MRTKLKMHESLSNVAFISWILTFLMQDFTLESRHHLSENNNNTPN